MSCVCRRCGAPRTGSTLNDMLGKAGVALRMADTFGGVPPSDLLYALLSLMQSPLLLYSGALGSGCCILSKYPIVSTLTRPYTLCGSPLHFIEGDWYVAKACGQAVLDLGPELGYATVLNTHMAAFGGPEWSEHWKTSHRLSQAWELARLVSEAADRGHQVFVCGDLNSRPTSLVIQLLLSQGELSDSWVAAHPPEASSAPSNPITAQDAITYHGITCDNPINSFSAAKRFDEQVTRAQGKRLDYILYRSPTSHIDSVQKPIPPKRLHHLTCVASHVTATELVPGASYSLSDHFGIESTFQLTPLPSDTEPGAYVAPIPARPPAPEHMRVTIEALIQYSTHVERLSRRQLGIFAACLALIPGISVAASFQPIKWLNWVFVILGIANGALGATMLYTGFVGGRWEMSALKNAIKDMTLELERYERRGQR